jgi:hypothetical protein
VDDTGIGKRQDFAGRQEQAQEVDQQIQTWRSGDGQKLWLSMLIDAMEEAARPEFRNLPCDRLTLAAVSAQLSRPASFYAQSASHHSLRN